MQRDLAKERNEYRGFFWHRFSNETFSSLMNASPSNFIGREHIATQLIIQGGWQQSVARLATLKKSM